MIEQDLGAVVARTVADNWSFTIAAGGQSQFSALLELEPNRRIQNALAYANAISTRS